ncbi:MAG: hypothetical protein V1921_06480 [Candidatus Altiarchaeota archaeon]
MTGTKIVKLNLEGGGADKLPQLKEDIITSKVFDIIERTPYNVVTGGSYYERILEATRGLTPKEDEIQEVLTRLLSAHKEDGRFMHDTFMVMKVGYMTNALIHHSRQKKIMLILPEPVNCLGYRLEEGKEVILEGNAGGNIGCEMKGAKLTVNGNVRGNLGTEMTQGEITVNGSVGGTVGEDMEGGKITVNGEIKKLSDRIKGGEVWQKNNRVWPT